MSRASSGSDSVLCPSAQPEWEGSITIGMIGGTVDEPCTVHFASPKPVSDELLALSAPVTPTEVFRFAAPCMCAGCVHFADDKCLLAKKIVKLLPAVTEQLPRCAIRLQCRWWRQEGRAACLRCPQVVTANYNPSEAMRLAADPATSLGPEPQ
jgi:hypothetical protein